MNPSPTSFTKYLGHRQIVIKPISCYGKIVRGISTTWTDPLHFPGYLKQHFPDMKIKA